MLSATVTVPAGVNSSQTRACGKRTLTDQFILHSWILTLVYDVDQQLSCAFASCNDSA